MKNKLAIAIMLSSLMACNQSAKVSEQQDSSIMDSHGMSSMNMIDNDMMKTMHTSMMETKLTGSLDCDFATMMITHHQSAIAMSKLELEKGTDPQMKSIAADIIKSQQVEINEMHTMVENFKTPVVKDSSKINTQMQGYMSSMMDEMMNMKLSGNTDKDFASLIIPHHESAIKMAKDELTDGKQNDLKMMAAHMIKDQSKELESFKSFIKK